jgi:hypothetical protein
VMRIVAIRLLAINRERSTPFLRFGKRIAK